VRLTAALCLALAGAAAFAQDVPSSWKGFQASSVKGDKELVAKIEKAKWWDNCIAWGAEARKKSKSRRMWALQEFLNSGKYINGQDLGAVTGKRPEIGMTTCGALAVLGAPSDQNVTQGSWGTRVQYVWRERRIYVYTETRTGDGNAPVTSIQF